MQRGVSLSGYAGVYIHVHIYVYVYVCVDVVCTRTQRGVGEGEEGLQGAQGWLIEFRKREGSLEVIRCLLETSVDETVLSHALSGTAESYLRQWPVLSPDFRAAFQGFLMDLLWQKSTYVGSHCSLLPSLSSCGRECKDVLASCEILPPGCCRVPGPSHL